MKENKTKLSNKEIRDLIKKRGNKAELQLLGTLGAGLAVNHLMPKAINSGTKSLDGTSAKMVNKVNRAMKSRNIHAYTKNPAESTYRYGNNGGVISTPISASPITAHELGHAINHHKRTDKQKERHLKATQISQNLINFPVLGLATGAIVGRKMARDAVKGKKTNKVIQYLPEIAQSAAHAPTLYEEGKANARGYHIARHWGGRNKVKRRDILPTLALSYGSYLGSLGANVSSANAIKKLSYKTGLREELLRRKRDRLKSKNKAKNGK